VVYPLLRLVEVPATEALYVDTRISLELCDEYDVASCRLLFSDFADLQSERHEAMADRFWLKLSAYQLHLAFWHYVVLSAAL
jgi:hypothetical protein